MTSMRRAGWSLVTAAAVLAGWLMSTAAQAGDVRLVLDLPASPRPSRVAAAQTATVLPELVVSKGVERQGARPARVGVNDLVGKDDRSQVKALGYRLVDVAAGEFRGGAGGAEDLVLAGRVAVDAPEGTATLYEFELKTDLGARTQDGLVDVDLRVFSVQPVRLELIHMTVQGWVEDLP